MAWPKTGTGTIATGSVATGDASYMRWGTKDAITSSGGWGYLTITRMTQNRKKEDLQFENGDGVQCGRMQLFHGVTWNVTVRDDTRLTYIPLEGTYVTIVDMAGHIAAAPGTTYSAYVLESNYDTGNKQPGERTMTVERIKLIEG